MNRRNTKQRQIILNAVQSRCDHPNADQIYNQVHGIDSKISLGTVYRNLDILSKDGSITDIKLSESDRFDLRTDKHNHLVCEQCGKVFDVDIEYDNSKDEILTHNGYYIYSHQTIFKGLCPECYKINNNKTEV